MQAMQANKRQRADDADEAKDSPQQAAKRLRSRLAVVRDWRASTSRTRFPSGVRDPAAALRKEGQSPLLALDEEAFGPLVRDGYQVIPGVLTPEQCAEGKRLVWKYLEGLGTGLKRDDPDTWYDVKGEPMRFPPNMHGILQRLGVGQCEAVWYVRQIEAVREIFARLWGVHPDDLLVSFDGMSVGRPHEASKSKRPAGQRLGEHFDQGPKKRGLWCVQGLVTLNDMDEDDQTLGVVPGSHLVHQR